MANLRDAVIFQDFTVWIKDIGKIGVCPSFQPPDIQIQVEEFRGGGMDGAVEIPMGIEKIEFEFDMHTWDTDIWANLGYGPGSMDVPVNFYGYTLTPNGTEGQVFIQTRALLKSIKTNKIDSGKKADISVSLAANYYKHSVGNEEVCEIDLFAGIVRFGGVDKNVQKRQFLGIDALTDLNG